MNYSAADLVDDVYAGLVDAGLLNEDAETGNEEVANAFHKAMSERDRLIAALQDIANDYDDTGCDSCGVVASSVFWRAKWLLDRIYKDAENLSEVEDEDSTLDSEGGEESIDD